MTLVVGGMQNPNTNKQTLVMAADRHADWQMFGFHAIRFFDWISLKFIW